MPKKGSIKEFIPLKLPKLNLTTDIEYVANLTYFDLTHDPGDETITLSSRSGNLSCEQCFSICPGAEETRCLKYRHIHVLSPHEYV